MPVAVLIRMRLVLLCSLLAGCATASTDPRALAKVFAEQPDTTPALCRANVEDARDAQDAAFDRDMDKGLVAVLVDGKIAPPRWRACMETYLRSASTAQATALDEAIGSAYRALIRRRDFEKSPVLQERLRAMQALYLSSASAQSHTSAADRLFAELRAALATHALGTVAHALGAELLAAVDLEHGRWEGRPVDDALLDALYAKQDVATLERMVAHLPTEAGRDEARRRVIRLQIASSSFPEVRAHATEVEERVLTTGMNAIVLDKQKPVAVTLDPTRFAYRGGVRVEQDLARQSARLVGYTGDDRSSSELPEVQLRGALQVRVEGIASPVTLCGSPAAQDPTPCIAPKDIHIDDAIGSVDADGAFHFARSVSMDAAVTLGAKKDHVTLTVVVGHASFATERLPLSYARPRDLLMTTRVPGGNAPDLSVTVDHRDPARYVFTAADGHMRALAIVEAADVASFRVKSVGGAGANGENGTGGMDGTSGGECGSGTSGSDGGDGGDGGPGGDGGNVTVHVLCGATRCDDEVRALGQVVLSIAGAGGDGGAAGDGGSGGAAGTGRRPWIGEDADGHHIVLDGGCSGGPAGSDGLSGRSGSPGRPGHAGRVRFVP
jgi:hypothetical protein